MLARPDALNAMSMKFFEEFDEAMSWLERSDDVNVILVRVGDRREQGGECALVWFGSE